MRMMGHNVLAVTVAAIAIYAIEFILFGMLISPDQYSSMSGIPLGAVGMERMPFGVIPPVLAAIGLSSVIKWRNAPGWMGGLMTALIMAVLFGFGTSLYGYIYGTHAETMLLVDLGHFLVAWGVAGAILGAWK